MREFIEKNKYKLLFALFSIIIFVIVYIAMKPKTIVVPPKSCINNCSNNGTCNTKTGQCDCNPNFKSEDGCNSCILGYSGNDCSIKNCSPACGLNRTCDTTSGTCICATGFTGPDCSDCQQCGTGGCCVGSEPDCIDGSCCSHEKNCVDSQGKQVCCSEKCCSDIHGNQLCCGTGQSCTTEDGCCDKDKVYSKNNKIYCCNNGLCNGSCCNDVLEICDPSKSCRTDCGNNLNCDPDTEVCSSQIIDSSGKKVQSCSKKTPCQWSTDLIYEPPSIGTASTFPLYTDQDGTISWCQGGAETDAHMSRKLHVSVDVKDKCLLGDCYDKLKQQDMNFDIWDETSGKCDGIITAKHATVCNNTCPTGINPESCCKDITGAYNGIVCNTDDAPICGADNKCYKGYSALPDPNNLLMGNICQLTNDSNFQYTTLEKCWGDATLCADSPNHQYDYDKINNKCNIFTSCPTGLNPDSCCKNIHGIFRGSICAGNAPVCGTDDKCYKGYECAFDIKRGQNLCNPSNNTSSTLNNCNATCSHCASGFKAYDDPDSGQYQGACYREAIAEFPHNSDTEGAPECTNPFSCTDSKPTMCGPGYNHSCMKLGFHCDGYCDSPAITVPTGYWYCDEGINPSWVNCKNPAGCAIVGKSSMDDRTNTVCPSFELPP